MQHLVKFAVIAVGACVLGACHQRAGAAANNGETGAVLTGRALANSRAATVEELFVGRFAGVQVFRHPNGGLSIQIRGATSIHGNNEPLYVVDGQPLDAGPGGTLLGINPADIARIEVLKDIGSTSYYGVRGANGVVLITLKKK